MLSKILNLYRLFFNSFYFLLFYWAHARLNLMFYLFAIDVFVNNFYFIFITAIRFVFFRTVITFRNIFAFFVNVFIFITIKALNYSTFFYKPYRILSAIFFLKIFKNKSVVFFRKFCFNYKGKICFFQFFYIFKSSYFCDVLILWNISFCFNNFSITFFLFFRIHVLNFNFVYHDFVKKI